MKSIHTDAIITGIRSRVDKSLGISISTPELSTQEKAVFLDLQGTNVELLITPKDEEAPEVVNIDKELEQKTPSQRLRSTIFVYWTQQGEQGKFEDFYKDIMEKFIDHIKNKLD